MQSDFERYGTDVGTRYLCRRWEQLVGTPVLVDVLHHALMLAPLETPLGWNSDIQFLSDLALTRRQMELGR